MEQQADEALRVVGLVGDVGHYEDLGLVVDLDCWGALLLG
jgi:hypothetical protein